MAGPECSRPMAFGSPTFPWSSHVAVSSVHVEAGGDFGKEHLSLDSPAGWRPAADSPGEHVVVGTRARNG